MRKLKFKKNIINKIIFARRNVYILLTLIGIAVIGYIGYFLYINFYQTITQSQEIVVLKQEVAPDTINRTKVDSVLKNIEEKTSTESMLDWDSIVNFFIPYESRKAAEEVKLLEPINDQENSPQ